MGALGRILSFPELKSEKGIPFSRVHVRRLVKAGRFPKPIKLSESTIGWISAEVDAWLHDRAAERDEPTEGRAA